MSWGGGVEGVAGAERESCRPVGQRSDRGRRAEKRRREARRAAGRGQKTLSYNTPQNAQRRTANIAPLPVFAARMKQQRPDRRSQPASFVFCSETTPHSLCSLCFRCSPLLFFYCLSFLKTRRRLTLPFQNTFQPPLGCRHIPRGSCTLPRHNQAAIARQLTAGW